MKGSLVIGYILIAGVAFVAVSNKVDLGDLETHKHAKNEIEVKVNRIIQPLRDQDQSTSQDMRVLRDQVNNFVDHFDRHISELTVLVEKTQLEHKGHEHSLDVKGPDGKPIRIKSILNSPETPAEIDNEK